LSLLGLAFLVGLQVTNAHWRVIEAVPLEHSDLQQFAQGRGEASAVQGEEAHRAGSLLSVRGPLPSAPLHAATDALDLARRGDFVRKTPAAHSPAPRRPQFHRRLCGADSDPDCHS
jgi:hypothetical protein